MRSYFLENRRKLAVLAVFMGWCVASANAQAQPAIVKIVSAASLEPAVAPNSLATILGANLSVSTETASADSTGNFPTTLGGTQVSVAGQPAQLLYASPGQVNIVVPAKTPVGEQDVSLQVNGTTVTGRANVAAVAPGIFTMPTLRLDRGTASNSITNALEPFPATSPLNPGDDKQTWITLYGTGFRSAQRVTVNVTLLDGLMTVPLTVSYSGPAGSGEALDQVNVPVPPILKEAGVVTLSVVADGVSANPVSVQFHEAAPDTANVPGYVVKAFAGTGTVGYAGDRGQALQALLQTPAAVALDSKGSVYVADAANHVVRVVNASGGISTFAGNGSAGSSGDGGPAIDAQLMRPSGLAVDRLGDVYVADVDANRVRMVDTNGNIHTIAGTGVPGFSGDGGPATLAQLDGPSGLATDRFGNLFIADTQNHRIREITADGRIRTLAGDGVAGDLGDGGVAQLAELNTPDSLATDYEGTVYVADSTARVVRAVDPDGNIRLIAGTGEIGDGGDDGVPAMATFTGPLSVSTDRLQRLFIVDAAKQRIRLIALDNLIHPLAGDGTAGEVDGTALKAEFNGPAGIAIDPTGTVFIADASGNRVREMSFAAGNGDCNNAPSFIFDPSAVVGGQSLTGYLTLPCPAPADTTFTLTSSLAGVIVPVSVTIPTGQTEVSFPVTTPATDAPQTVIITATGSGTTGTGAFTMTPGQGNPESGGLSIASITVSPSTVAGGQSLIGRVVLGSPAPAGGAMIALSADQNAASIAATINVPAGQLTADFLITTVPVRQTVLVHVVGKTGESSAQTSFTILSSSLGNLTLTLNPSSVIGGSPSSGTVTLDSPAPADGALIELSSDNGAAMVPATILIPAGQSTATFEVATSAVLSSRSATITATSANTATATITMNPPAAGPIDSGSVLSFTLSPTTVTGGESSAGVVTLTNPAGPDGAIVTLTSDKQDARVPGSVTIASGKTSISFEVTTATTGSSETATISAALGNSVTAALTINATAPAQGQIAGITLDPSAVTGGSPSTGTVTLKTPAPANGVVVTLGSDSQSATVPESIVIPAGQTSGTFTVGTSAVGSMQTATITATSANSMSTALTLNASNAAQGQIAILSIVPSEVTGGSNSTGTVTLSSPAPVDGVLVTLASNNVAATVPPTITIAAGQVSGVFTVTTSPVASSGTAIITATSANSAQATLTIDVTPPGQGQIANIALNPTSLTGGSPSTGTVTLVNPAPVNGISVSLGSDSAAASVPASITIAGGQTTGNFTVTTISVASNQTANITATSLNSVSAALTITPGSPGQGTIQGLTLDPSTVTGGDSSQGTVTLASAAGPNGVLVTLASNNAGASVPGSIVIAAGQTSGTFAVNTAVAGSTQTATITSQSANSVSAALTINTTPPAQGQIANVTLNPSTVTGGSPSTGTVTLAAPAPANGILVSLGSDNGVASVPASITIPGGQTSASFTVNTSVTGSNQTATITATSANSAQAALTINATPAGQGTIAGLTLTPSSVTGGSPSTGTVTLNSPAPVNGVLVNLASNNGTATLPASVTIPGGQTSATFTVSTAVVGSNQTATITATSASSVQTGLTISATPAGQGTIAGLTLNPSSVTGGSSSTGTVTLSSPAPVNGILVTLASNNGTATIPASITISAGQTSGTFTVSTSVVGANQSATITATSSNSVQATLTINATPAGQGTIASLMLNPTSVTGGSPSTGTVTLSSPAPVNGVHVTLSSNNTAATVPAGVDVPSGQTSATFTVATTTVNATQVAGITAVSANSVPASLTVNPNPCVSGLVLTANITDLISGNGILHATATLTGPAPSGGTQVQLIQGGVSIGTINVASGQTSGSVDLTITNLLSLVGSTVQALVNGCSGVQATIALGSPITGSIASLTINPGSLFAGAGATGTVTLASPAGSNGVLINLGTNNSSATVIASTVVVPAGQSSTMFPINTVNTSVSPVTVTLSATSGASAQSAQLVIDSSNPCVEGLQLTVNVTDILTGGGVLNALVTLTGPAPAGGENVPLLIGDTQIGQVSVLPNQTTGSAQITLANLTTLVGSVVRAVVGPCGANATISLGL